MNYVTNKQRNFRLVCKKTCRCGKTGHQLFNSHTMNVLWKRNLKILQH